MRNIKKVNRMAIHFTPKEIKETKKTAPAPKKFEGEGDSLLRGRLNERLAFERTGILLYEAMIQKVSLRRGQIAPGIEELRQLRDEKLDHFQLVMQSLREMGEEPVVFPVENPGPGPKGILKLLSNPRTGMAQSLSALLNAEIADQDDWKILVQLVECLGMEDAAEKFRKAVDTEQEHVRRVRLWLTQKTIPEAQAA